MKWCLNNFWHAPQYPWSRCLRKFVNFKDCGPTIAGQSVKPEAGTTDVHLVLMLVVSAAIAIIPAEAKLYKRL